MKYLAVSSQSLLSSKTGAKPNDSGFAPERRSDEAECMPAVKRAKRSAIRDDD
ncbi:MAG: hypothetical protein LBH28_03940 [Oscillospiraceae bacterium]|nr:hypothetical protein [Oscillospiraceae bacterium]